MKKLLAIAAIVAGLLAGGAMPVPATAAPLFTAHEASVTAAAGHTSGLQQAVNKTKVSWPWYITRASGLIAAVLLVLLTVFGIGLITGYTYRIMEPLTAWSVHRALGIALGVSILIHVTVLLFDKFVPFSLLQVFVPFMSHYAPVTIAGIHLGSLYVALGVVAFYVAAAVILSSLFWQDKKPGTWRLLHYLGYLLVILVFVHGLYLGTDLKHGVFRVLWLAGGVLIVLGIIFRLRRVRTINEDKE